MCSRAAVGVWAAAAQAITYSQQTLGFSGLSGPSGVAVDGSGDLFAADYANTALVELLADGNEVALPFSGLKG